MDGQQIKYYAMLTKFIYKLNSVKTVLPYRARQLAGDIHGLIKEEKVEPKVGGDHSVV